MSDEQVRLAREERDRALQQLAEARAELDALRQALAHRGEPEPRLYPDTAAPDLAPPRRYVLVDAVHGALQALLGRRGRGGR